MKNHDKQKTHFSSCLSVSVSSAKMNIAFDDAVIVKVKLIFLSCKEIPDYFLRRI